MYLNKNFSGKCPISENNVLSQFSLGDPNLFLLKRLDGPGISGLEKNSRFFFLPSRIACRPTANYPFVEYFFSKVRNLHKWPVARNFLLSTVEDAEDANDCR